MTIFHLLLLVLVFSTESTADSGVCSSQTRGYDELLLVLRWPTSYCNTGKNKCNYDPPLRFTVHGLWFNENSRCANCEVNVNIKFDQGISSDLRKQMKDHWPDLKSKEHPENFWIREFRRHGHCIKGFSDQAVYFSTALKIKNAIGDVMKMSLSSEKSQKTLTRRKFYHVKDFDHVTINHRKLTPGLRCNEGPQGRPQLHEIVFCMNRFKIPQSCTSNVNDCGKTWKDGGIDRSDFFFP